MTPTSTEPKNPSRNPDPFPFLDRTCSLLFDWLTIPGRGLTRSAYHLLSTAEFKPRWQRNIPEHQGKWPSYLIYVARSLHCFYGPTNEIDLHQFQSKYTLLFQIGQKIFYEAPLIAIPETGILLHPDEPVPPGYPEQIGDWRKIPLSIPDGIPFGITLNGQPFKTRGEIKFLPVLNGFMERPVQ